MAIGVGNRGLSPVRIEGVDRCGFTEQRQRLQNFVPAFPNTSSVRRTPRSTFLSGILSTTVLAGLKEAQERMARLPVMQSSNVALFKNIGSVSSQICMQANRRLAGPEPWPARRYMVWQGKTKA